MENKKKAKDLEMAKKKAEGVEMGEKLKGKNMEILLHFLIFHGSYQRS